MTETHLFVVLGDVTHVACDAWMLPTDRNYTVTHVWQEALPSLNAVLQASKTVSFSSGKTLATPIVGWANAEPLPVLTAVPFLGIRSEEDLLVLGDAVREFVVAAANAVRERAETAGGKQRPVPLLAMPSFGTAGGGGEFHRGRVLRVLLENAAIAAKDAGVDIVLVLRDEKTFALAQEIRKQNTTSWVSLGPSLIAEAQRLAVLAREGKLVPFMGAGVSVSAGGATWRELIAQLADQVGLTQSEREALYDPKRDALDQAAYLRARFSEADPITADGGFSEAIVRVVDLERYGLAPALLASLRTEQAITLNYDTLFEQAAIDAGDARTVIPSDGSPSGTGKWLLKLHGSVTDPAGIVLTRDDYLGYNTNREALSAIVKANLITHHLLFVGFGLADDHFHQIVHDVRRALPKATEQTTFATALTMRDDPLDATLWRDQLNLVSMGSENKSIPDAGRRLEIFLDALLAYATDSHSYLLAGGFESSLTTADGGIRDKLLALQENVSAEDRTSAAWPVVERMLHDLGFTASRSYI